MANNKKRLGTYLVFAFGIAWVLQIIGSILALNGSQMGFTAVVAISMFAPAVAAIIAGKGIGTKKTGILWRPRFKGCIGAWLGSWLGMVLLAILGCVAFFLLFPKSFDPTFSEYMKAQMGEEVFNLSYGTLGTYFIPASMLINVLSGSFINMFFALGEEAGWRGYMYPILKERFGRVGGLVLGGLIWGVWHAPVILLAGYEYGWSLFTHPWWQAIAGVALFSVITVLIGIIFDRLYERSRSIWVPSLAHGTFNAAAGLGVCALTMDSADMMWLGPAPIGIVAAIPLVICAAVMLMRKPIPANEGAATEAKCTSEIECSAKGSSIDQ